jgi:hypothetical protein
MKWAMRMGRYDVTFFIERLACGRRPWWARVRSEGYQRLRVGAVGIEVEDVDAKLHACCRACGEPRGDEGLKTLRLGNEMWDYCWSCQSVEPGIEHVSKRELEAAGRETW